MSGRISFILWFVILLGLEACTPSPKKDPPKVPPVQKPVIQANFNADSAYSFVATQVDFGPRVPGTKAHAEAADWLLAKLKEYADTAYFQIGTATMITGEVRMVKNIIASFNPDASYTTLLAAHWDTRPQADEDPEDPKNPADGANDGGSGVGVLLEIARQLSLTDFKKGVDIVFFDQEDAGERRGDPRTWCVGSQFWGDDAMKTGYTASQGILLDMVGAPDAVFCYEKNSMRYNPGLMRRIWKTGQKLGYGRYFLNTDGGEITDDHIYMTKFAGVPSIDIIHYNNYSRSGFPEHWHTHDDNMSAIDRSTLQAVGHTVMHFLHEVEQE
jgi:glutaminyl-peptide cyclotransferase